MRNKKGTTRQNVVISQCRNYANLSLLLSTDFGHICTSVRDKSGKKICGEKCHASVY